jgi:hypothetical protein
LILDKTLRERERERDYHELKHLKKGMMKRSVGYKRREAWVGVCVSEVQWNE